MLKNLGPLSPVAAVVATASILALTACQGAEEAASGGENVDENLIAEASTMVDEATSDVETGVPESSPPVAEDKFIVLIPCAQSGEGCAQPTEAAEQAAEALGWRTQIIDGQGTVNGQSEAINNAISLQPDGIITFAIDPESVQGALNAARDAGIHVAASSAKSSDLVDFSNSPRQEVFRESGEMLANYLITETEASARTLLLNGGEFTALQARTDGFTERMEDCATCEIAVEENFAIAEMATALPQLVQQTLQSDADLDSIYLMYDAALPYVLEGLQSVGRDDVTVVTADGVSAAMQCLRDDCGVDANAVLPMSWMGWAAMDGMNRVLNDEDPSVASEAIPTKLLTPSNVQEEPGNWDGDVDYESQYEELWSAGN